MSKALELDLTLYPAPVLRKVAEPVETFDEDLKALAAGMFELMVKSKGVGLAAPQVGLKKRVLVLNPTGEKEDDLVLVNPVIKSFSGPKSFFEEGCLSFPGIYADIERPERCTVEAFDALGQRIEGEYDGFVSRIIQHEFDHLEGVLLVHRMTPADKLRNKADLEELVERYKAERA